MIKFLCGVWTTIVIAFNFWFLNYTTIQDATGATIAKCFSMLGFLILALSAVVSLAYGVISE